MPKTAKKDEKKSKQAPSVASNEKRFKMKRLAEKASENVVMGMPIRPPQILTNIVPKGKSALAMDESLNPCYQMDWSQFAGSSFFGMSSIRGFPGFPYLSQLMTRAEYRSFASSLSTELTRKWIEFHSTQDDGTDNSDKIKLIENEFNRLGVREVIQKCAEHDCAFGRGQIFIDIAGADRNTPLLLDPKTIKKGSLSRITTVEAIWTTPSMYNALDPVASDFYKPSHWFMLGQEVHASRLMTIITRPLPDILKPAFNFAGISLSQLAEPYVDNWLRTRQSVADLVYNFSITAISTSMDQILQGNDDGADLLARADLFTATRSNKGIMLIDKEREDLIQVNTPLSGLHELQAQAQEHMCSVSKIPAVILTGISPSGFNNSGETELLTFNDWIAAQQNAYWRKPIQTILDIVQLSLFGEIDSQIGFKFVPLKEMNEKEKSDIRFQDSQTAQNYINAGVLDPIEPRRKLAHDPDSGYEGLDMNIDIVPPDSSGEEIDPLEDQPAEDGSVSEAQHRAMEAAAHGHSTLGIPKKVGKEFVAKDKDSW